MHLILYSKPDCHLCEGLQEKLEQIQANPQSKCRFELEIRDITSNPVWFQRYQYEIPVLCQLTHGSTENPLPRPSPRLSVERLESMLEKYK
ncbi:MAG: glutaredoxin family protein [Oscillatoriales cyanobacterium RM2_1_1]|nr:glutaredoxin family protein [Oscillatoriales cyanobacterium SM2_3_0]NJO47555.1 glutaredoxin family protein [Oscillatoriales cyanobacterium RM2_1_1]